LAEAVGKEANIIHIPSDFICKHDPSFTGTLLGDKAESVIMDNSKIKRFVPEFKAIIPFREGIRRTIAWFDAHPERKVIRKETNESMDGLIKLFEK
jgi:nucleoside-diphosphate-sugar epimerase